MYIAGRAGRYGTQWEHGYVTTFKPEELSTLKTLLNSEPENITQAGLHPTADQIELYAYHLPNSTLSNLMVSDAKLNNMMISNWLIGFRIYLYHFLQWMILCTLCVILKILNFWLI